MTSIGDTAGTVAGSAKSGIRTASEPERLMTIARYGLHDSSWSNVFKDIALLAAKVMEATSGAVNVVGEFSVWSAAHSDGIRIEIPREYGFCPRVVQSLTPVVVPDAQLDERFARMPSVAAGETRSYCGVPLISPEGLALGSVCAWGDKTNHPSPEQLESLLALSRQATALLEMRRQSQQFEKERLTHEMTARILGEIVSGTPVHELLSELALAIERQTSEEDTVCSILFVNNGQLRTAAAPSLPVEFSAAVDGLPAAENVGSCGRAAATGKPAMSSDIATDPAWSTVRDIALKYGFRSCFSVPVFDNDGNVTATFALYYHKPRHFDPEHSKLLTAWANLVGLAIMRSSEQEELRRNASTDPLTGLPNRTTLKDAIRDALERPMDDLRIAVFLFDLDGFKLLNDSLGHAHGDDFLVQLAQRLSIAFHNQSTVGRLGGDEFVVVHQGIRTEEEANELARSILDVARIPTRIAERTVTLTASVGIALSEPQSTPEEMLRQADAAMYTAKAKGRNTFVIADDSLRRKTFARFEMEVDLRDSTQRGGLSLLYQPNVALATGLVIGMEALARWNHSKHGNVPPSTFIPIAEESGLIHDLGEWVLKSACHAHARRRESDPFYDNVRLWVNISASQLDDSIFSTISNALNHSGLPANRLGLEITESVFMQNVASTSRILTRMRSSGISIAIDDFGTGFSSMAQLRKLPVDIIKIDRAFTEGIGVTGADESVVVAILRLGEALGIRVVAEGVETPQQRSRLLELGCKYAQGYLFGRPGHLDSFDTLIKV